MKARTSDFSRVDPPVPPDALLWFGLFRSRIWPQQRVAEVSKAGGGRVMLTKHPGSVGGPTIDRTGRLQARYWHGSRCVPQDTASSRVLKGKQNFSGNNLYRNPRVSDNGSTLFLGRDGGDL